MRQSQQLPRMAVLLICALLQAQCLGVLLNAAAAAQQSQEQQQVNQSSSGADLAAAVDPPSFCRPADTPGAAYSNAAGPTDMVWGGNMLKVYHNLYYHNKKWYAVLDTSSNASSIDAGISLNTHLIKLPTTDTESFQDNVKVCYVPGVTLFIDFPFPAFPDNLGHWAELLLPLYSALSSSQLLQLIKGSHKHIDRLLLLNVRQQLVYSWPREVLGLALAPALPAWPDTEELTESNSSSGGGGSNSGGSLAGRGSRSANWHDMLPWDQPLPPIINPVDYDAWCANGWLVFENVLVLQDRYQIVSIPDETRPARPQRPPPAAAAAAAGAAAAAAGGAGPNAVPAGDAGNGMWASDWVVGFNKDSLAAKFRAAALARHMWDRPVGQQTAQPSQAGQHQQHEAQQHCEAASETCTADPAAADGAQQGAAGDASPGVISSSSSSSSSNRAKGIPRFVTVLWYPEDYPPVTNHLQLVRMMEELTEPYGFKVRTVSLTMGAPFLSHMATMADTGILVGRHGPLLASAVLLPPGAAVLELLPYKWEWRGVSTLYYNMTQSTGQLHHWAWRPLEAKWCKYKEPSDARYAGWLPTECQGRDCLLVHAQAGLEVDLDAVRQLLARKLPGLLAGDTVEQLREPWPAAE